MLKKRDTCVTIGTVALPKVIIEIYIESDSGDLIK